MDGWLQGAGMVRIFPDSEGVAAAAAQHAFERLEELLRKQTSVRLLAATGASQMRFLELLTSKPGLDWTRIELFHLDEYIGLGVEHRASFARYIKERIVDPTGIRQYHLLDGRGDPREVAKQMSLQINAAPIDLAFAGIGENGHLAFNDPPADFETEEAYRVVVLDEACRHQQVGEGWFLTLADVPERALTISIVQLLKSNEIVSVVPDERKATAVKRCLEGEVSNEVPASVLRVHPNTHIFLDAGSASLLEKR